MKVLFMAVVAVMFAVPSAGLCADVYVPDRAPMKAIEPGKVYQYNWKPGDLPKDAVVDAVNSGFTSETITNAVYETERAMIRQDAKGAVRYFFPSAVIHIISVTPGGGEAELELTRDEYAKYLKEAWRQAESYYYKVEEAGVVMSPDGRSAMLKFKIYEEAFVEGRRVKGRAVGIADVRGDGHGPMISRMVIRGIADMPQ